MSVIKLIIKIIFKNVCEKSSQPQKSKKKFF